MAEYFTKRLIKEVWASSKDAKPSTCGAPGVDGVTAKDFKRNIEENINSIYIDIKSKKFEFNKLRLVKIPKDENSFRIIAIPTVRDRLVQRAILKYFLDRHKLRPDTPISYGSVPGKSVNDALDQAVKYRDKAPIVLQTDITKFFDTIDRAKLKKSIPMNVCVSVRNLIIKAIDCEIKSSDSYDEDILISNGIKRGRGLRQGMPLSPLLSNFFLKKFDEWLLTEEVKSIRYVDDICVFKKSADDCLRLLDEVKLKLKKLKLSIPEIESASKTCVHHKTDAVQLLGVEIKYTSQGYKICPQNKKLPKIKAIFEKVGTLKFCIENKLTIHKLMQKLDAIADGHRHALRNVSETEDYLKQIESFRDKQKEVFLYEFFGKFLETLDSPRRAVLGLGGFEFIAKPK